MHPQHEQQINDRYTPRAAWCCQAQLDTALYAALHTRGEAATYWVEECERLIGRIALARAGGTLRDAVTFLDKADYCRDMAPQPATQWQPGTLGWHELVDRSCLIAELFSERIAQHPAAEHPALKRHIKALEDGLFELYQVAATL